MKANVQNVQAIMPGAFGLARIGGLTGKLIAAFQAFAGDGSRWTHAFVVLNRLECIEAEPGGARVVPISKYLDMKEVAFCDRPVMDWVEAIAPDQVSSARVAGRAEVVMRGSILAASRRLEGTKYGYLQYVYLGLLALAGKDGSIDEPRGPITRLLAKLITSKRHMICSQLVDEVYRQCGIQLFTDKRLPQNVTPGDLAIRYGIG